MYVNQLTNPIVWIDCEMTGLDIVNDGLVEISVVITDSDLVPVDEGLDLVIKPTPEALASMGDFVRNMHTESGLIDEWDEGLDLAEAESRVLEYLRERVPAKRAPLGGNSVGTDKAFLERDMPAVIDHLHYRVIDVSTLKELARRWYPRTYFAAPAKFGNHRALGDIYDSIDELRYYRSVLMPEGDGPSSEEARKKAKAILDSRTQLSVQSSTEA
ncbi:oligoribonuclease [Flaviflexus salsibiostraticola]|uniref:Oligoribonuclease n=1 Tax=Flaviflexus salsibiostraticola TaxID=1282737 RepID=A0A3Q8WT90_9ACTO|nr:oligoribonuclease [Flaviflexus salsibiostraticola]AZN29788.1 oligoribonuclease [Flaviflexus salsibiostraticola]